MTCEDYTEDLNALLDGELSPDRMESVTTHLAACPDCRQHLAQLAALRAALQREIPEEAVTPEFFEKISALLDQPAEPAGPQPGNIIPFKKRNLRESLAWLAATSAVAAMLTLSLLPHHDVTKDLMSVRDAALRPAILQNIALGSAPIIPGFRLASARSDIVAGHPAQVFAYQGAGEPITLCVWAANGEKAHGVREAIFKDTKIAYWNDGRSEYWAATTGSAAYLGSFVTAIAKS
jgi:anti-sigma factor RsiW